MEYRVFVRPEHLGEFPYLRIASYKKQVLVLVCDGTWDKSSPRDGVVVDTFFIGNSSRRVAHTLSYDTHDEAMTAYRTFVAHPETAEVWCVL